MNAMDAEKERAKFRFLCEIDVQFRDLDALGHVNNAVFFSYFEVVRTKYYKELDPDAFHLQITDFREFPFILGETGCRFISPAFFQETLVIYARTSRIGKKSFDMEYLVTSKADNRVIATGKSTHILFNYKEGHTFEVPESLRKKIEDFEIAKPS